MPTKAEYNKVFVTQDPQKTFTIDDAYIILWHNIRKDGGLRLSDKGFNHLKNVLQLESYEISIKNVLLSNRFFIDLDRLIKCPYYISLKRINHKVILFDKKIHFALTMYGGDFEKFCNAHKI